MEDRKEKFDKAIEELYSIFKKRLIEDLRVKSNELLNLAELVDVGGEDGR